MESRGLGTASLPADLRSLAHKTVADFAAEFNDKDLLEVNLQHVIDDISQAKQKSQSKAVYNEFLAAVNGELRQNDLLNKAQYADGTLYRSKGSMPLEIAGVTTGKQIDLVLAARGKFYDEADKTLSIRTVAASNYKNLSIDIRRNKPGTDEWVSTPIPDIELARSTDQWLAQHKQKIGKIEQKVKVQVMGSTNHNCESSSVNVYKAPKAEYNFERQTFATLAKNEAVRELQQKARMNPIAYIQNFAELSKYEHFDRFKNTENTLVANGHIPQNGFIFNGKLRHIERRDMAFCSYYDSDHKVDRYSEYSIRQMKVRGEKDNYCMVGAETGAAILRFTDNVPLNMWFGHNTLPKPNELMKLEAERQTKHEETQHRLAELKAKQLEMQRKAAQIEKLAVSCKIEGYDEKGHLIPLKATMLTLPVPKKPHKH